MTELSAAGYPARLIAAVSAWEARYDRVGRGGNQSELHRQMAERFGELAPSRSAVSKWLRTMVPPEPHYGEVLASILGVRPAWLYFADGPMSAVESEEERKKREFLEEQARRHPPASRREKADKGRKTG